ncbi:MAG: hypothetical protein WC799_24785 [Desulfobacteraceae bacterium]|jgi:hypothetical protein
MTEGNTINPPPQETSPIHNLLKQHINILKKEQLKLHREATSAFKKGLHDQVATLDLQGEKMAIRIRALNTTASVLNPTNPLLRPGYITMMWLGIGSDPAAISDIQSAGCQLIENSQAVETARQYLYRPRPNIKLDSFTPDRYKINQAWIIPGYPELVLASISRSEDSINWPTGRMDLAWMLTSQPD